MSLDHVRAVADAVLYEGYLLYPYRASSRKNQSRWQFGVLGPPGASADSFGEEPRMSMQCLLDVRDATAEVAVLLRFLQLQVRFVERLDEGGGFTPVDEIIVDDHSVISWDEAVEREVALPAYTPLVVETSLVVEPVETSLVVEPVETSLVVEPPLVVEPVETPLVVEPVETSPVVETSLVVEPVETRVSIPGGEDVEDIVDVAGQKVGRIVRRRWPLTATVRTTAVADDGLTRLSVEVENVSPDEARNKDAAIRASLIGTHVLLEATGAGFVSLLEPPPEATEAAALCHQSRCWPVLVGAPGSTDVLLGSPIILYDYPEIAAESAGGLFDSTEIDEILTLRVMTMTDEEKAEARATDPRAKEIIDRCDEMTPQALQQLHGVLRNPHADPPSGDVRNAEPATFDTGDVPWWDPASDESVRPEVDSVVIDGVSVAKGSLVRVHPSRRADAQDLFFADQVARVTAVLSDVDGGTHVALVLVDDPAAEMHDWYGRYLYFAPDELEPLDPAHREESRP
jgi:hypothetical protein